MPQLQLPGEQELPTSAATVLSAVVWKHTPGSRIGLCGPNYIEYEDVVICASVYNDSTSLYSTHG